MCIGGRGCACGYAPRVSGCVCGCTKTNSGPETEHSTLESGASYPSLSGRPTKTSSRPHGRRSAYLHGIPRATRCLDMQFAPSTLAFPPYIPPQKIATPPVLHTPHSPSIWTTYFVHHCQCFATHDPHHTTPCFVLSAGTCFAYVCLPPPSSFLRILWL